MDYVVAVLGLGFRGYVRDGISIYRIIVFLFFDPDRRLIAPRWDRGGSVFALPQRYLFTNTILYCTHNSRHERQFP